MAPLTEAEAEQMFALYDTDANGVLSPLELVAMVKILKGTARVDPAAVVKAWCDIMTLWHCYVAAGTSTATARSP